LCFSRHIDFLNNVCFVPGHGDGGELVSQFALYEVQHRLEKHASFNTDIEKAFKETFISVDESLKTEPDIEVWTDIYIWCQFLYCFIFFVKYSADHLLSILCDICVGEYSRCLLVPLLVLRY
jgi:hypothetical protein